MKYFFKYLYLHELRARCSGATATNLWGANTIPRSSVVLSSSVLFFPVAIAALALLHFAFGAFGLVFASAVGFGFCLELPLV